MQTWYPLIKHLHMTIAILSILGFVLRYYWKLQDSRLLQARVTRVLPHVNDTLLLLLGLSMLGMVPVAHAWLAAKLLGLVAYIGFGMLALKRCQSRRCQWLSFTAAVLTFVWIFSVARSRELLGFLAPLFA